MKYHPLAIALAAASCHVDAAITTPAQPAPRGLVGVTLWGAEIQMPGVIEYDKDDDHIQDTKRSLDALQAILKILKDNPSINKLRVEGHTDSDGNEKFNESLSKRRAAAVVQWLVDNGVEAKRLDSVGCAAQDPLVPNTTTENKQLNRRTELDLEVVDGQPAQDLTAPCAPNPARPKA